MLRSGLGSKGAGCVAGTLGIAAITAIGAPFHQALNLATVTLAYLLAVLVVAAAWGSSPAWLTSALAVLCLDFFFLPPLHALTLADPQHWLALAAFVVVAIAASQLFELAKRRAAEVGTVSSSTSTLAERPVVAVSDPKVVRSLNRFVAFASLLSIAVGLAAVISWKLGIPSLRSVLPGRAAIRPNAAVALLLCGCALWLLRFAQPPRAKRKLAGQALASLAALLGLLSLLEQLFGWNLAIDQLLFPEQSSPWRALRRARPGFMAPIAALEFLLIGLALLCLDWTITYRSQRYAPAQVLAFAANTGAVLGLLDFVLGAERSYSQMALQTASSLFVLSFAVVCARTGWGLGALFVSTSSGGVLTRRLWPAAVVIPLLIGSASWKAYSSGLFSEWTALTVMIVAMITLLGGLTVWSGQSIDRSDAERRRAQGALHRSEEELREAQRLARAGSWWWDLESDTLTWSEGLYRVTGQDPRVPPPRFQDHSRFYTPESFARLERAVAQATQTGSPFGLELQLVHADGSLRWVASRGEAEREAGGRVVLVRGTVHDVTEQKQAEAALRTSEANLNKAQEIAHVGSWQLEVEHDALSWSNEVFQIFGIPQGTPLTYQTFLASIHPDDRAIVEKAWAAALQRAPYDIEHRIVVGDALKWVRERAELEFDEEGRALRGVGTVQDITERKRAQEELLRINRAHRALSSCNQAQARATEESALLEQVCRIIVAEAGFRFCWVGRAEHDEAKTVAAVAQAGVDEGYLQTVKVVWADTDYGRGPTGTCIRTRQQQIVKNTATDPRFAPWRTEALKRGYASMIAIPIFVDAELFGALHIYAAETEAFHDEEVALLSELAGELGYGVTTLRVRAEQRRGEEEIRKLNAELEQRVRARTADLEAALEREVKIGFKIQQMLLLTQPPTDLPGLQLAALTIPSQRIDGDFYDFFKHDSQCLDVMVADVMGKGIPAALVAAATKSNFLEALCHLIALSRGGKLPEPKAIVTLAHADMVRQLIDLESFVTLSYTRFDLNRRQLDLVDCGHTGMLVVRARTGVCEALHGDNLPLGIREGESFDQLTVSFEPGDLFLFYSDGITEMRNPAGELYGEGRLLECVRIHRNLEPQPLVDAVRQATVAFAESDRLVDDLTCVAVKISGAEQPLAHSELEIGSDLKELAHGREFVREFCRSLPEGLLDAGDVAQLELAVSEAASNIMKHAYHGRVDQRIQLEASRFLDHLSIKLYHLGEPIDVTVVSPPALDGSRESGFGIYLIGKSVDEARYSRDEQGRNCTTLIKALKR